MLHVSIIVVNYNGDEDTVACLESLQKLSAPNYKYSVIVVDNGSQTPLKLPKRLSTETIQLIRSESNLGFTGGNNMGIYYATEHFNSDYILLLNNDTTVDDQFLKQLVKQAQADDRIGIACSKIYFSKGKEYHKQSYTRQELGSVLWYAGGSIDFQHLVAFHRGVDELDRGQFDHQTESDFATGCSMLIKREVLEKVGSLDKRFFIYLEDVDLSLRAKKHGYTISFCPQSIVYHKNAGSTGGSGSPVQEYYQTRNRLLFAFKHGNWKTWLVAARLIFQYLSKGNKYHKQAVFHALTAQFGKQPIV